jgi:1,4-dihydroxy-2-naphthoyl-CoA hydrolase
MMQGNQAAEFTRRQQGMLPGELGLEWEEVATGRAVGRFTATKKHMAPNGFMHAASVICLADSACGYACVASLPEGATGFTTIELRPTTWAPPARAKSWPARRGWCTADA